MSYESAISHLLALGHELHGTQHKFELQYVRTLLDALGNPQARFRSVLIAGTNGKGSTAATLASILIAAGHRTALYTSPHLVRINERIRINGDEISDENFAAAWDRVESEAQRLLASGELPWHPSFFEMLTAMAFVYFAQAGVDIAVLEVGMGGRLDATNVVEPVLSVITDISLDHQKFLGDTVTEISREKAGIIRPNGIVVTLPQHSEANAVIGNRVLELGARAVSAVSYVPPVSPGATAGAGAALPSVQDTESEGHDDRGRAVQSPSSVKGSASALRNRYSLDVMGERITVDSPLVGRHQLRNIALAISAAEQLNSLGVRVTPQDIERGIAKTDWPGRFESLPATADCPEIVLDVAHNPAGAWALRSSLNERYPDRPITLVFGMMRDKAVAEVAQILLPVARRVIVTQAVNPRSATTSEIRAAAERISTGILEETSVAAAVDRACALARSEDSGSNAVVVITGSIYIVGEALAALEDRRRRMSEPS